MKSLISHFSAPNAKTVGAVVTAAVGMVAAFHWLPKEQAEAGGAFALTLLALLKPSRKDSE